MALSILPVPPQRSDPANFAARGDAFMAALPTFVSEFNAQVPNVVAGDQGITGKLTVQGDASIAASLSAWGTSLAALQLGVSAFVSGRTGSEVCNIGSGAYDDGTNWKYSISSNYATRYQQDSGIHKWFTAPTGTAGSNVTFSESMRIDSSGNLLVGRTANAFNNTSGAWLTPGGALVAESSNPQLQINRVGTDGATAVFYRQGSQVGTISVTATATSYNTSSDRRLKTAIVDAPASGGDIDAIRIRSYDWITDGSHQTYGVIAQELADVAPYAVHQPDDPEQMMAVDYSKLVPLLVKEVQSLRKRVAELETA